MKSMHDEVDEAVPVDAKQDEAKPETDGTSPVNGPAEVKAAAETEAAAETKADAEPAESEAKTEAEPEAKAESAAEAETEPEAEAKTEAEVEPAAKTEPAAKAEPEAESEAKSESDESKADEPEAEPVEAESKADEPDAEPADGDKPDEPEGVTPAAKVAPAGLADRIRAMRPPSTVKGRIMAGAALVVVLALAGGGVLWYQSTHLPDGVAFRVYGQDVTATTLDDDVQTDKALFGVQPPTEGPRLDAFRRDFAKANAVSMVIDKAAADRHIAIADRQVSDVLARYITQYYGDGPEGHDRYVQALANQGTSEAKVLAELKRQMALQQLITQVTAGVTVSDQDVSQAFDQRRAQLATPELRDLHNIVVRTQLDADDLVNQLHAGANFEQLAQQRSLDDSTKNNGGDLGAVSAAQLEKPYADAAFAAPVSGVFGPVQTQGGYNVGKVVAVQPPAPAVFDKIKDQLRQALIGEKSTAVWTAYLSDLIKQAHVRYSDTYRPADPDSLPAPAAPPGAGQGAAPAGQPGAQAPAGQAGAPAPAAGQPDAPAPAGQPSR
jgi:parvulin-like peptidyl-prolyl isomerase